MEIDELIFGMLAPLIEHGRWVLGLMVIIAIIILWWAHLPIKWHKINKFTSGIKDTSITKRSEFVKNYGDMPNDPWKDIPKNRRGDGEWKLDSR